MIKYNNTNNASCSIQAGISASSTTLLVDNGDILPTAPFLLTLEHFENESVTVREIVKCIAKVGNTLTIQRGSGTCVQDDTATPKAQNNTPHSFSVGDVASIYWTAEQVNDIQNEIEKKLNIDDFQAGTYVYGATSTGTDAYSITIPGTITSYQLGQVFRFIADVDNQGPATLNINSIGAIPILKNHDKVLDNGDIESGQIVEVAYDGENFQMNSAVATVVDIASLGNTQYKTGVAGEDLEVGDVCCLVDFENDYFEMKTVGQTEASVDYEVIGNGESSNSITLWIGRRGNSSGEDLVVELLDGETVIASSQVARAGLTEDTTVETVCSWGESIETEKGKVYTLRLRTYDNSVDADKGFYYNHNDYGTTTRNSTAVEVFYKKIISSFSTTLGKFSTFKTNVFSSGNFNSEQDIFISSGNDEIKIVNLGANEGVVRLFINGTQVKQVAGGRYNPATANIYFYPGKIVWGEDEFTVEKSIYLISSTTGGDGAYRYTTIYLLTTPNTKSFINYKTTNLNKNMFYKGTDQYLFINSSNVAKGNETSFETGGESNIFSGTKGKRYGFMGNIELGCFGTFNKLKYKPRYYLPLPTINTDFSLGKDAIMFIQGNLNGKKIKKGGSDYITFPDTNYLAELKLEGGYTYQIDFDPSAIQEFYLID